MLDHVSITVSDFAAAERFYDVIMKALEIVKVGRSDRWLGYGERADAEYPGSRLRRHLEAGRGQQRPSVLQGKVAKRGGRVLACRYRCRLLLIEIRLGKETSPYPLDQEV
jgi:catechol 2,3-dioxygenase-like lactoylglutathione lyase family enzyme